MHAPQPARGIKTDDFISDLRVQAEERARQSLALDAVAAELKLEATEEDIRAEFERAGVPNVESAIEEWRKAGRLPAIRQSRALERRMDSRIAGRRPALRHSSIADSIGTTGTPDSSRIFAVPPVEITSTPNSLVSVCANSTRVQAILLP